MDKAALASALGSPASFGQSQFAFMRGNAFEAKVKADGGKELMRLLGIDDPHEVHIPDLAATGPEGRAARTALALREATGPGGFALLDHPMLALDVAGSPAYLEPDAVVVHPDGRWTVVEIKSFPMIDAAADAAKVGAAARQAAVYVLALERLAALTEGASVAHSVLLVCPKDFTNMPTASVVDVRKQLSVTRRQLTRLARLEDIAAELPDGVTFDVESCSAEELADAVEQVPHAYAPECLAACELAFHCRDRARCAGTVEALGRSVRGELGGLTTVGDVLAAARGEVGDPDDPAVDALRRAAALRAESLRTAGLLPPPRRGPDHAADRAAAVTATAADGVPSPDPGTNHTADRPTAGQAAATDRETAPVRGTATDGAAPSTEAPAGRASAAARATLAKEGVECR